MKLVFPRFAPICLASLACALSCPVAAAPVVLPLEVMGVPSAQASAEFAVTESEAAAARRLKLVLHGLSYEQQASVRLNGGEWIALNNANCRIENSARFYGGIGGPITNLRLSLPISGVRAGSNTVTFRFNGTDGVSSGFRVREIDLITHDNQLVLKGRGFEEENPATWRPKRTRQADIEAGKKLWYTAPLRKNGFADAPMMEARCTDCHAQDGRDLKYFNFSSFSIEKRAQFHGLSRTESEQISSYIRSLDTPSPGRPWNPPFQPGPGTDERPLEEWSAGAGLDAVLERDADSLPYIFPDGISSKPLLEGNPINFRETPVAFELPDWNHWLPRIHPKDGWGEQFSGHLASRLYDGAGTTASSQNLRQSLASDPAGKASKRILQSLIGRWSGAIRTFLYDRTPDSVVWSRDFTETVHSVRLWELVKTWELHQEFELEGLGKANYGPQAESRNWFTWGLWQTAPFDWARRRRTPLVMGVSPLANSQVVYAGLGTRAEIYANNAWFYLQLIANNGNGIGSSMLPWEYFQNALHATVYVGDHSPMRRLLVFTASMQLTGAPDDYLFRQWRPYDSGVDQRLELGNSALWADIGMSQRQAIQQAVLDAWVDKNSRYSRTQYAAWGAVFDPGYLPSAAYKGGSLGSVVNQTIRAAIRAGLRTRGATEWAKSIWTAAPEEWDKLAQ